MSTITIGSVNCRGLSETVKRIDIFTKYKDLYDITILVDTHSTSEKEKQWLHEWGYVGKFSSYSSKSRGVAILFKNTFEFKIHEETIDLMGNFIILDITIQDYRITLAAIYGPNNDDPVFFENIKHKISRYSNSSIVVAGDWNVVQDYDMDTLHYRSENNPQSKAKIHEVMHELDLLDIWRQQHPFDNRYSWRGPNHKQSRLDYFMITSDIEAFVVSSDIGISYRSDHSPVLINLRFSSQIRGKGTWKFNNSLLRETEFIEKVKGDIKTVIEEYESDPSIDIETEDKQFNISYQLLWDMIKMKVRGSAISFSSFQKKEGNKKEKDLLYKISLLDEKLLENNLPSVYQEREGMELELKILREKMLKGIITRAKARWQVEGEKGSNYFCNLEKKHYTEKIIPKLILEDETEITDPSSIRNEQKQFYKKLYTSCKPLLLETHRDTFLQHDNPFITKPNEEETQNPTSRGYLRVTCGAVSATCNCARVLDT
ncbi:unnamed protein product [Mytilus edulis]|uniref:exodeoxyribonuclease III n=1 Tax=Mytilus edulis TaxID=6550 RepID=A0A8S3RX60_MYTED|nr:unnamed protein product [Mytilus edulis]